MQERHPESDRPFRLAVVSQNPIQYTAPLYRKLAGHPRIDLTVYYCSKIGAESFHEPSFDREIEWDVPLLEGYDYRVLPNLASEPDPGRFLGLVNPTIVTELVGNDYDAVLVHGYRNATDWLAIAAGNLAGTKVFYRSEASLVFDREVDRPARVRALKGVVLRSLFSNVDRYLAIGSLNEEFYRHHGVPKERIHLVPYAVDNERFRRRSDLSKKEKTKRRADLGIPPDAVVFLFAAKFTPKKNPLRMIEAYAGIQDRSGTALVMAGDGPLQSEAEALADRRGLDRVHFPGFLNQSEMPVYYGLSDVFVRPDGLYKGDWGLTINEAMACGLCVVSTDKNAAVEDLVEDGENGYVVPLDDRAALTRALEELAHDRDRCAEMGDRSWEIVQDWSHEAAVDGILEALEAECGPASTPQQRTEVRH